MAKKKTSDAVKILHKRFYEGKPKRIAELEQARADDAVARKIYDLRAKAGLSQRELAKLIGSTASVICRLEDADYEGHSMAMLNRIAAALDKRVEIRFVPLRRRGSHSSAILAS
jgi:ribosome-binding protein aMBF1 (putative translation factor)